MNGALQAGDATDAGFITIAAVANPCDTGRKPESVFKRATGYTILTCDPDGAKISIANWPYLSAPGKAAPDDKPFPGWPIAINPKTGARL